MARSSASFFCLSFCTDDCFLALSILSASISSSSSTRGSFSTKAVSSMPHFRWLSIFLRSCFLERPPLLYLPVADEAGHLFLKRIGALTSLLCNYISYRCNRSNVSNSGSTLKCSLVVNRFFTIWWYAVIFSFEACLSKLTTLAYALLNCSSRNYCFWWLP